MAKLSWANDGTHDVFRRMSERVGDMSGLSMKTAEVWQIQNYGIGGHYKSICAIDFNRNLMKIPQFQLITISR